nr:MAG TPA: hypothetical protein [Caudoviricetes sp.]
MVIHRFFPFYALRGGFRFAVGNCNTARISNILSYHVYYQLLGGGSNICTPG